MSAPDFSSGQPYGTYLSNNCARCPYIPTVNRLLRLPSPILANNPTWCIPQINAELTWHTAQHDPQSPLQAPTSPPPARTSP